MDIAMQVRLYAANTLDADEGALARMALHLDPRESARAERFVFDKHRRRFVVAHGFLREVLGRELELAPAAIAFEYGRFGKPRVAQARLHFNLTHTGEHALLAVGERELGLDAEEIRPARVDDALAARVMTEWEFEVWSRASRADQVKAFFRLWSAKESVMKACGRGMDLDPGSFAVLEDGTLELRRSTEVDGRAWAVQRIDSPSGFALAMASEGEAEVLRVDRP